MADGVEVIEKSGVGAVVVVVAAAVTWTVTSTKCDSDPLVPVTLRVNVPVEALGFALIVNVDAAVSPAGGVIGLGST